tara:strand:+ start:8555 stop:9853 length:1299 start_codon:yes stop_codon:yes gene_type:complete
MMQANKVEINMPDSIIKYKNHFKDLVSENFLNLNNNEDWKYNKLNFIKKNKFTVNDQESLKLNDILDINNLNEKLESLYLDNCYNIVFISGKFYSINNPNHDLVKLNHDVFIGSINQYMESENFIEFLDSKKENIDNYFQALNNANFTDGFYISIIENIKLEKPINIIFINNQTSNNYINNLKNYIILEKNSTAQIFINYLDLDNSNEQYFLNNNTEILLGDNSELNLYKTQNQNLSSYNFSYFQVNQNEKSSFKFYNFSYGSLFSKDIIRVDLNKEHAFCGLYGIINSDSKQYIDVNTRVNHNVKNCSSFENYKGIADDKSTAVLNGSIVVKQKASNTDARMSNKNLLLSDNANIYTKPELKIYNDDVKCSHGTTIGSLDNDALFYLQSRGLSYFEARKILIEAFLGEIIELDKNLNSKLKHFILDILKIN